MKLHTLTGIVLIVTSLIACGKKKFTSKPQLTLKSVSATTIPLNASEMFTFEFTDAEGDLDGAVGIKKTSSSCTTAGFLDTVKFQLPSIPASDDTKGTLTVNLTYTNLKPTRCFGGDSIETATFQFWIKDKAGNISDTVTSPSITIRK